MSILCLIEDSKAIETLNKGTALTTSAYQQHPIHEIIQRILDIENQDTLWNLEISSNEQLAFARDRVFAATKLVSEKLNKTSAINTSIWGLSQIQNALQNIFNEITAFISNKNTGHLINAQAHVDQSLYSLMWVFSGGPSTEFENTATATALDTLNTDLTKTFEKLTLHRDMLNDELKRLSLIITEQDSRIEGMTTVIAAQKAEAESVNASLNRAYAESEASRKSDFLKSLENIDSKFTAFYIDSTDKANELITKIDTKKSEAEQIVQVVGNIGATGNFQIIANRENTQANIWRLLTMGFFLVGVELALLTFLKFYEEPFHPENSIAVIIRLLFAAAITAPAWYTARESARHRSTSDRARQTELELASLGPFIELMPNENKISIREELTKKYFGNKVEDHKSEPPLNIKDLQSLIVETIKASRGQ